jgi:NAD(P)-dependent dehydrogenase (short-subunit alcohol dehydrogenase family)
MVGKVCLVTGATSGIGRETAQHLAEIGATVVGVGRDPARCAAAAAGIQRTTGNPRVAYLLADLSIQSQIRRLAGAFLDQYERLDVLINNAGGFFFRREVSADGIEMTFALNHLNYFLLTDLLLERIASSTPARIVNVSSNAHYSGSIYFQDIEMKRGYNGWRAYAHSKLMNVLFTYELARRLKGNGVTANTMHPGFVATRFGHNNSFLVRMAFEIAQLFGGRTPAEGAQTIAYLASSLEVEGVTGSYFVDCQPRRSSQASYDIESAKQLWEVSQRITRVFT